MPSGSIYSRGDPSTRVQLNYSFGNKTKPFEMRSANTNLHRCFDCTRAVARLSIAVHTGRNARGMARGDIINLPSN